jgi:hypothetical protein
MRYLLLIVPLVLIFVPVHAQNVSACGVVDAIRLPIDNIIELTRGYDDFGLYRERFGGLHTGIDIAFDRLGDPIYAAARGRVTYSDPVGWDTEKGVVIVEHTFPDGNLYYTGYGHVEQTDTIFLTPVDTCVEMGDVIAAVGWPSRGRPHLHYEIRTFLPNEGGPGYVSENPLLDGWLHPLDFTMLWQTRLLPGYVTSASFQSVPSLPPVSLDSGGYAIASADVIEGVTATGATLWRVQGDDVITGLAALSGDRVIARTRAGLVMVLQGGNYRALWTVQGPEQPFVKLPDSETLVFVTNAGLAAYDANGTLLWTSQAALGGRISYFGSSRTQVMLGIRSETAHVWSLFDGVNGMLMDNGSVDTSLAATPAYDDSWYLLDGAQLSRYADGRLTPLSNIGQLAGRTARMSADANGVYIYTADTSNTLLALTTQGEILWRTTYPYDGALTLAPLIVSDSGCLLYTLDANGVMNAFSTADGTLLRQTQLYSGGTLTGSPRARLLRINAGGQVEIAAGFLSLIAMDGRALVGSNSCIVG